MRGKMNQDLIEDHENKETVSMREYSVANYFIVMAVDTVLLYVLNNLRYMNISLVTADFTSCLWAVNLALGMGIIGNFTLLLYRPRWFHNVVQLVLSVLAIFGVYIIYKTFPFDIGTGTWQIAAKVILILIMAGIAVGFILDFFHKEKNGQYPQSPGENPPDNDVNQTPL
jgi:hypothetical protein